MSDGSEVSIPEGGVIVLVGPNNAGKSVTLRDIRTYLTQDQHTRVAVKDVEVDKDREMSTLMQWLTDNCQLISRSFGEVFAKGGIEVQRDAAESWWMHGPPYHQLGQLLVLHAAGEHRLQAANGVEHIDTQNEAKSHPLHNLAENSELVRKISVAFKKAFGSELTLSQFGGKKLYLHLGVPEASPGLASNPNPDYVRELKSLPTLDDQGDGMKSFMGLALQLFTSDYPFVLVDEPEAFLHPPQARLMGQMLAEDKSDDSQVFVATHNSDIMRGLLNTEGPNIKVVRLRREGDINRTSQLDSEDVRTLWQDPLLRYSNILDGLFHEGVLLCEGDADCRFYNSILDELERQGNVEQRSDVMFTQCGGKDRMPFVIKALSAVQVPVHVIADFDVLRSGETARKIVEELGGDWEILQDDWKIVNAALESGTVSQKADVIREKVDQVLDDRGPFEIQREDEERIKKLIKPQNRWAEAKRSGKASVPPGNPTVCLNRLLTNLRDCGLFVVDIGELENFVPTINLHGPSWVNEVHAQGLHRDPEATKDAREFVNSVTISLLSN